MTKKGRGKFAVEKPLAKGLPPGWTKEIRVKKKGGKRRKDLYYIDPASGQIFRSLKDVSRYLETKDCSGTEQGLNNLQAAGSISSLPSEAEELKAGESKSDYEQLAVNQRKEEVAMPSSKECCMSPSPGNSSHQCKRGAVKERNNMLEASNEDDSSPQCQFVSDHIAREMEDVGNKSKTIRNRRKKLHEGKGSHLPLRTSKRLAGIKADSSLELKTNNNSHHQGLAAAPRQKGQKEAGMTDIPMVDDTHGNETKHEAVAAAAAAALPPGEPESSSLMMKDVWMDPCIEFAIKTLTGAIPCIGEEENKADKTTPQSSLSSSAGNLQSRVEELPFGGGDVWALDPCIEFAAKILTGEIPISVDACAPEKPLYKQQQQQQKCWLTKFSSNQPIV